MHAIKSFATSLACLRKYAIQSHRGRRRDRTDPSTTGSDTANLKICRVGYIGLQDAKETLAGRQGNAYTDEKAVYMCVQILDN